MNSAGPPTRASRRRVPLLVYLLALVALPLLVTLAISGSLVASNVRRAGLLGDADAIVAGLAPVQQMRRAVSVERFHTQLKVNVDHKPVAGLELAALEEAWGFRQAQALTDSRRRVDESILALGLSTEATTGTSARARLANTVGMLSDVRRAVDTVQLSQEATASYYERLIQSIEQLESSARVALESKMFDSRLSHAIKGWAAATELEWSSLDVLTSALSFVAPGGEWLVQSASFDLASSLDAGQRAANDVDALVDPDLRGLWEQANKSAPYVRYEEGTRVVLRAANLTVSGPEPAPGALPVVPALRNLLDHRDATIELRPAALGHLGDVTNELRKAAIADGVLVTGLAALVLIASVAITAASVRSIRGPLLQIGAVARALRVSANDGVALKPSGPSELASAATAMRDLAKEVALVEAQADAVSLGNWSAPALRQESTIAISAALRRSVHSLSALTSHLRSREEVAKAILDSAADAIWTVDDLAIIRDANKATEQLLGWPVARMLGRPFGELLASEDDRVVFDLLRAQGSMRSELQLRRADGSTLPALVSGSSTDLDDLQLVTIVARDITDRKELEQRLAHQATHDMLTGLPNRAAAVSHLERVLIQANLNSHDIALLFIDLDRFKVVNDSHGHRGGDALLSSVAERMSGFQAPSVLPARLGGDEFVVVVSPAPSLEAVVRLGQELITTIEQPYTIYGLTHTISASVGICYSSAGRGSALSMLRDADHAVYQAKERGGGCVQIFDDVLREAVDMRARTETDLRQAIERDELVLNYQPIVDALTGALRGVEVLVRWQHPTRGLVFPDTFIPVAEESMLIVDLGRWVFRAASAQVARWQQMRGVPPFTVSVNISGRHVVDADVYSDVRMILDETGADPRRLKVEVTESRLISEIETSAKTFQRLRDLGLGISIDDFGTGYSGFTNVRSFPIDQVKIDRSFVRNLGVRHQDTAIVETVINLAAAFGIDVVAEGVETDEQRMMLASRGCTFLQGWLIAPAMTLEAFTEWMVRDLPGIQQRFSEMQPPPAESRAEKPREVARSLPSANRTAS